MNSVATVACAILDELAAAGVEVVFGLPGVHNLPMWSDHQPHHPKIVGVRHEQAAVYAADGYARATGRLGVAITTTGPGAANAMGAFGEAAVSGSPILLISSDVPQALRSSGPGPLPPGFGDRRVLYPATFVAARAFEQALESQYDIALKITEDPVGYIAGSSSIPMQGFIARRTAEASTRPLTDLAG